MISIAIQAFNKHDTILQTLDSLLLNNTESFNLYILQDSILNSKNPLQYENDHLKTEATIKKWIEKNEKNFLSVKYKQNIENKGTCKTGELLIDWAFSSAKTDYVIFSEDDVIFDVDAMYWFEKQLKSDAYLDDSIWAIAGESKIFDSGSKTISKEQIDNAKLLVIERRLMHCYYKLNFLPSSCFGVSKEKWAVFGKTRGLPNGDRDVNRRCQEESKYSLWPVVARCSDIGMNHSSGYTMLIFKDAAKVSSKNQNITSTMFEQEGLFDIEFLDYSHGIGELFLNYCRKWNE